MSQQKTTSDLRELLFETITAVKSGTLEIDKTKVISELPQLMVNTAKAEVAYAKARAVSVAAIWNHRQRSYLKWRTSIRNYRRHSPRTKSLNMIREIDTCAAVISNFLFWPDQAGNAVDAKRRYQDQQLQSRPAYESHKRSVPTTSCKQVFSSWKQSQKWFRKVYHRLSRQSNKELTCHRKIRRQTRGITRDVSQART